MNYSIWIKREDDGTFDINVWDEVERDRVDDLEQSNIPEYSDAYVSLYKIIEDNPHINFIRLEDTFLLL